MSFEPVVRRLPQKGGDSRRSDLGARPRTTRSSSPWPS